MKAEFEMETKEVDRGLASEGQEQVSRLVHALPDDPLSMVWRSGLNARLALEAAKQRRKFVFGWMWKPALGFAACMLLASVTILRHPAPVPTGSNDGVEQALVKSHIDNFASMDVAGVGLTPAEQKEAGTYTSPADWDPEDITSAL
jgi:hypothetical protein